MSQAMSYTVEDCVHAELSLPSYVIEIINTKEFQRLKNLKQLGVSNFVFKSATHSRAEHCIGTAYLCSRLLENLERNSSQKVDDLHKKCVILAGLLHDIGHGPYSHLWEGVVRQGTDTTWTHERQGTEMIEHMINSNNIRLDECPEKHDFAVKLITSLITGDSDVWKDLLEPEEMFITEIVSNKFCNVDVDKCDYLLRDHHYLKGHVAFKPFVDFLQRARIVFDSEGTSHVGYHLDDFELIENMFINRAYFHMNVYQMHQVAAAERMVKDICMHGDAGGVTIAGQPLTEVQRESSAFLQLDDSVLDLIDQSKLDNQSIRNAQDTLRALNEGRHYSLVWESCDDDRQVTDQLLKKFGKIFCEVEKVIPAAEVPSNIPLYSDNGDIVEMTSNLKLGYKSTMVYCTTFDVVLTKNIKNYIDSFNNNI